MGHDIVQTEDMKQEVELLRNENDRLGWNQNLYSK